MLLRVLQLPRCRGRRTERAPPVHPQEERRASKCLALGPPVVSAYPCLWNVCAVCLCCRPSAEQPVPISAARFHGCKVLLAALHARETLHSKCSSEVMAPRPAAALSIRALFGSCAQLVCQDV